MTKAMTQIMIADKIQQLSDGLLDRVIMSIEDTRFHRVCNPLQPLLITEVARVIYGNDDSDVVALENWLEFEELFPEMQQALEEMEGD